MFQHPAQKLGRSVAFWTTLVLTLILAVFFIAQRVHAGPTTKEDAVVPVSIVIFTQCGKAIGATWVYSDGTLHPIDPNKFPFDSVMAIADKFDKGMEHRLQFDAPCLDSAGNKTQV